ncbi:hypothetical protein [Pararhodobacter sp. CCB-MM2]|uniref:hypothetical protein n=1 Tax=Pararhodobacter sp. CCB-MM2 TaxID=1786003 RepID=UPI00082A038A|nr:hypothetical protein [Pararhodobacter sp. CCB-MM2]
MLRLSLTAALCLAASALPGWAQWTAVGRWGSDNAFRYVQPGAWMHRTEGTRVEVSAEGDNHQGRLTFRCEQSRPEGRMVFEMYRGPGLNDSVFSRTQPAREFLRLDIDGQSFVGEVEYRPTDRLWVTTDLLTPGFLDAFARGARLEMYNIHDERITAFGLRGTGAAREVMRRVCGI